MGYTTGENHSLCNHKLYVVWCNIKSRCYRKNCKEYKYYGDRYIGMCLEWKESFLSFYNFCTYNGWKEGLEIDRVDVNGNYDPSNCQFITQAENKAVGKRRKLSNNTSGYVGVSFCKTSKKYMSRIMIDNKSINLGYHNTIEQALQARINAELFYFNEQRTNL